MPLVPAASIWPVAMTTKWVPGPSASVIIVKLWKRRVESSSDLGAANAGAPAFVRAYLDRSSAASPALADAERRPPLRALARSNC